MFASLDRIDVVHEAHSLGRTFLQTDHRDAEAMEATPELTVLFALGRTLNPRQMDPLARVIHSVATPPSLAFREAVHAAGGTVEVQDDGVIEPEPTWTSTPADLANDAFSALALRVSARERLPINASGLRALATRLQILECRLDEDPIAYWTAVVELAAFTGEVLHAELGGRWIDADTHLSAVLPFCYAFPVASGGESRVNIVNKAVKFFTHGDREHPLLLLMMARDQQKQEQGPLMFSFKPHDWPMRDRVPCRPLLEDATDTDLPLLVYGRDLPTSFQFGATDDAPLDEVHERALEHLARQEVTTSMVEIAGETFIAVEGSFFAAEKVLDVAYMQRLQHQLGARTLGAVALMKGTLLVASADDPERVLRMLNTAQAMREAEPEDVLSTTPLLLREGLILGCARGPVDAEDEW